MVFTEILVVRGVLYETTKLKAALELKDTDPDTEVYDIIDLLNKKFAESKEIKAVIKAFNFPCCSVIREKYLFVGIVIRKIPRPPKPYHCGDCGDFTLCDTCIGKMGDGKQYNVDAILHTVVSLGDGEGSEGFEMDPSLDPLRKLSPEFKPQTIMMLNDCLYCS